MAGYPSHFGVPAVHFLPQQYYAGGYIQPGLQPQPIAAAAVQPISGSVWAENLSHDGRKYYYNMISKVTTWEKPEEFKSESERILSACPWRPFNSENGKEYYYNSQTKQSVWSKPPELIAAETKVSAIMAVSSNTAPNISVPVSTIGTPATPATPGDDASRSKEPSAIELAMKATLASYVSEVSHEEVTPSMQIPLPTDVSEFKSSANASQQEGDKDSVDDNDTDANFGNTNTPVAPAPIVVPVYKTRGEMAEGLRRLFREKQVPGNATWEQALKMIGDDPRYVVLRTFVEKKQIFNVYKTQRQKEEREEQRMRAKQAKEELERFLLHTKKIHSTMSYRKVDQVLSDTKEWTSVPDHDRHIIFGEVVLEIAKREKEEAKSLRKRNTKVFNGILKDMHTLTYRTSWSEAQQMLLENTRFTSDIDLQSLDKEDALVCFEIHIRSLEQEHEEEKDRERRRQKREHRKNREAFLVLLDEMHEQQLLISTSSWKDLFTVFNGDERFHNMLAQRGSTPLDLFKFYVENLKSHFPLEKKLIKELLKEKSFTVELTTNFEDFKDVVLVDERGKTLDLGNICLTFNSLMEKAQGREKERQREDVRRLRKQEQAFCEMLRQANDPPIRPDTPWDAISERFSSHPAFVNITLESERIRVFRSYLMALDAGGSASASLNADGEASRNPRNRKEKRRKARSTSREDETDSDGEVQVDPSRGTEKSKRSRHRRRSNSPSSSIERASEGHDGLPPKKKHKKSKSKSKKSKKYKSKHRDHGTAEGSGPTPRPVSNANELEEGEAADEDLEDDFKNDADGEEGEVSHRRHHRHRRQRRTSTREEGLADSISDDDSYDRYSNNRRKYRRS